MIALTADHDIPDESQFAEAVAQGEAAASQGQLVVFGIEPRWAETGYGYVERGQTILLVTHDVKLATGHGRRVLTLRDGAVVDDALIEPRRKAEPGELVQLLAGEV